MLSKIIQGIAPNVSLLEGNSIDSDERVSYGLVSGANVESNVESIDWTDSIINRCRFNSLLVSNSSFERVAFLDSDLSGVTFDNCLLRECLIVGIKAKSYLALENCIVDGVTFARSRADRLEIRNCKIGGIEFVDIESSELNFYHCDAHKRKAQVSFRGCQFAKVVGLDELSTNKVFAHVDAAMWQDLGDYYLGQKGFRKLDENNGNEVQQVESLLDEIGQGLIS